MVAANINTNQQQDAENGSVERTNNKMSETVGSLSATDWEEEIATKTISSEPMEKCGDNATRDATNLGSVRKSSAEGRHGIMDCPVGSNVGLAGAAYFHDVYSTMSEYYRGQSGNKGDGKDAAMSNDLLGYYQLVRQFYEQSMASNAQMPPAEGAAGLPKVLNATNWQAESQNLPSSRSKIQIKGPALTSDVSALEIKPIGLTEITIKAEETPTVSKNTKPQKSSCKTTPPKKRYSEYSHVEDSPVKSDGAKANLGSRFHVATLVPECVSKSNGGDDDDGVLSVAKMSVDERDKASPDGSNDSAVSMTDVKPITSTYLQLMRSMGLTDEDALKFDNLVSFLLFLHEIYLIRFECNIRRLCE